LPKGHCEIPTPPSASYAQAQAAADGRPDGKKGPDRKSIIAPLWAAYAAERRAATLAFAAVSIESAERKIVITKEGGGSPRISRRRASLEAHKAIE